MRGINDRFIDDLRNGELSFFLEQVRTQDHLLQLAIRDGYVNIYYRGGNLLKIVQKDNGYRFQFDTKYCKNKKDTSAYPLLTCLCNRDAQEFIAHFPIMIAQMDSWFAEHPKSERELQQKLMYHNASVVDIEYQIPYLDESGRRRAMRFDMIAVTGDKMWVIENKCGQGAISGSAGIAKHYQDINRVLVNAKLHNELAQSMLNISQAKHRLGLVDRPIERIDIDKTEILFLLASYNPNSRALKKQLTTMTDGVGAKLLFLETGEHTINFLQAKDLFSYEY